ncbi:MAG TPA: CPBP family intramembrane glutamic endopeptidase [Thermoleophilaceae bacterium]|nr:CPBP family intramembrane glutamic endopeptidase [Thermoleophilaceae bacterium]
MAEASRTEPDSPNAAERRPSGFTSFAQRRPITAFLVGALGIGLPLLMIPAIAGIPLMPFLLPMTFIGFLGSALVVTHLAGGPGAVRRLLSRLLIWRFSVARWAVIVFAMPVLVVALAAVSGTLEGPEGGWGSVVGDSLLFTFISGLLLINLWEETAWSGFMQSRTMERHGLLVASLLTALPVAVYHVPLSFEGDWTWSEAGSGLALVFGLAPFYRYLLGMHLLDTGGSLLAVAIQHASWNAANNLGVFSGIWQPGGAVVLLTVLLAVGRRLWRRERHPIGRRSEEAAARRWLARPVAGAGAQGPDMSP